MAALNRAFWNGKRVLLTGHTGFKGAWAAIWLQELGAAVTGLALPPEQDPSLFELAAVERLTCASLFVDLRDHAAVEHGLAGKSFDLVLHMAAQPIVRRAIADPVATFAANVMGAVHLLQALRSQISLLAILVITSDKVYANPDGRAFREGDALGGVEPYAASKAAVEIVTQAFGRSYFEAAGVALATARAGNVIGGGDFSSDRIVADIVRAARNNQQAVLRHPEATRPWQHVLDCIAGYLTYLEVLATRPSTPKAMNFGPRPGDPQITVGHLADLCVEAIAAQPWRHEPDPTSIEARSLAIDAGLAKQVLDFESRLSPASAIDLTMDWYRRQAKGEDALALCRAQIAAYESGA